MILSPNPANIEDHVHPGTADWIWPDVSYKGPYWPALLLCLFRKKPLCDMVILTRTAEQVLLLTWGIFSVHVCMHGHTQSQRPSCLVCMEKPQIGVYVSEVPADRCSQPERFAISSLNNILGGQFIFRNPVCWNAGITAIFGNLPGFAFVLSLA